MIPLRVRALCSDEIEDDFLVRLSAHGQCSTEYDREIHPHADGGTCFLLCEGIVRLPDLALKDCSGDVLLVEPSRNIAHRLIRASSPHNTFLITEQCDQLCVMCSQPPKKHHVDLFPTFIQAALLAPKDAVIGISGGEPTLYKEQLFEMIAEVHRNRPDIQFHVLTNAQHFTEDDLTFLNQPWVKNVLWAIPVYSDRAEVHDEIVGKEGALERLKVSFTILMRSPVRVELRTVLLDNNVETLPSLARFLTRHLRHAEFWSIMQLESIGYARMNWDSVFFDHSKDFNQIAFAINKSVEMGLQIYLYNFPLCTVPAGYRDYAVPSISDWKTKYLDECQGCSIKSSCGGFFEWYDHQRGFAGIVAQ